MIVASRPLAPAAPASGTAAQNGPAAKPPAGGDGFAALLEMLAGAVAQLLAPATQPRHAANADELEAESGAAQDAAPEHAQNAAAALALPRLPLGPAVDALSRPAPTTPAPALPAADAPGDAAPLAPDAAAAARVSSQLADAAAPSAGRAALLEARQPVPAPVADAAAQAADATRPLQDPRPISARNAAPPESLPTVAAAQPANPAARARTAAESPAPETDAREAGAPAAPARADSGFAAATAARGVEIQLADRAAARAGAEPGVEALGITRAADANATSAERPVQAAAPPQQPEMPARVAWLAQQGGGTARIALHPQELGEVEVSVRVRGRSVEVQFIANDPAAQLAVAGARERLLEALGARDLRMESFQVRAADDPGSGREFTHSHSDGGTGSHGGARRDDADLARRAMAGADWQGAGPPGPIATLAAPRAGAPSNIDLRV